MSKTKEKYNRFAKYYDVLVKRSEAKWYLKWRNQFFASLTGDILEVGIGTGQSMDCYNRDARVVGIDFSKEMLARARQRLAKSGKKNITLRQMDVENMEFKDNLFDYVTTSCVFCSVPNPIKGLREIRRVLKPGGRLIMIEHVLSDNLAIALLERIHNPITRFLVGVNINRNTKQNIVDSGMVIIKEKKLALFDVFRLFIAEKS